MTLSHPTPLQQPTCRSHTGWDAAHVPPPTHTPPRTRWNPPAQDPPGSEARRQTPPPSGTARGQRSRGHVAPPGSPPPRGCSARREQHPALRTLPPICIRRRSRGRLTSPPGSPDSLRRVPLAARPPKRSEFLTGRCPGGHPGTGRTGPLLLLPPSLSPSSLLRNKKSPHLPATMRSSAGRSAGFLHRDSARRWGSPNPATPPSSSPPPLPSPHRGARGRSGPPRAGVGAGSRCSGRAGAVRAESARRYEPGPVCRWGRGAFLPHRRRRGLQSVGAGGRRRAAGRCLRMRREGRGLGSRESGCVGLTAHR